jgi:hypothetical protein
MSRMSENVGASTSRNPQGLHGLYGDNFTFLPLPATRRLSVSKGGLWWSRWRRIDYLSNVYIQIYLSIYLSTYQSIYLSVYIYLPTYLYLYLPTYLSIYDYNSLLNLGRFFSFLILYVYTDSRTPWTGDEPVTRPLPAHRTAQTQNKSTQTSMPWVGLEPTILVFELEKTDSSCFLPRSHCGRPCLKIIISVALVSKRTLPTERPPHVGEVSAKFCG